MDAYSRFRRIHVPIPRAGHFILALVLASSFLAGSFLPATVSLPFTQAAHQPPGPALSTPAYGPHPTARSYLNSDQSRSIASSLVTPPTLGQNGVSPAAISLTWTQTTDKNFLYYTLDETNGGPNGPWRVADVINNSVTTTAGIDALAAAAPYWWQLNETGLKGVTSSNVWHETQPALSYLSYTQPTLTSVKLAWTNNATYGGLISFVSYVVFEQINGGATNAVVTITSVGTRTVTLGGLGAGSYEFYVVTTDCVSCGKIGAIDSATQSSSISLGGGVPLSATVAADRLVVDVGELNYFSCTPSGGKSPYSFLWDFGNGTSLPGAGGASHTFGSAGSITVGCTVRDASLSQVTASVSIIVDPDPAITASLNRSALDLGQSVRFSCTPSQGTPPYTVYWAFGDGSSSLSGLASHSYTSSGGYLATCSVTDTTSTQLLWTSTLTVDPTLTAAITSNSIAAAPQTILSFTGQASNGSGVYVAYNWSFGDGAKGTGLAISHSYATTGNYTAVLRASDSNGGVASSFETLHVSTILVQVATVSNTAEVGDSLAFSASATGGAGGPYNYTWNFGDGGIGYGAAVLHSYSSTGSIVPTLQVTDWLGAVALVTLAPLSVVPAPGPFDWLSSLVLIALGLALGSGIAVVVYSRRRRALRRSAAFASSWVPPVGPMQVVQGSRNCPACGQPNLPLHSVCESCGAPLSRRFFH